MKKISAILFATLLGVFSAFAYNPPVQGENLFLHAHPEIITSGFSTAGGGIMTITPASIAINPALAAFERRITIDAGYTAILDSIDYGGKKYGEAFGVGAIVPTDWANFAGELEGVFVPFPNMHLGNSMTLRTAFAKQFMEKLFIGFGLDVGGFWGYDKDWMLTADVGAVYNFGGIGVLKNFRIGASILSVGKTYNSTDVLGIKWWKGQDWMGFPAFSMIRAGAAVELVNTEKFILGLSLDVSTPLFTNLILDTAVQIRILNLVELRSSWEWNSREVGRSRNSWIPTVGVVFRINLAKGQVDPSLAWKNVDFDVNMISAGAVVRIGELDTSGPDIEMD